jgi:ABC-2 type transport system permease protein
MRRYLEIYSIMLRNSLIREMSFKANFILWMIVEVLWFCGQILFFSIIFGQVDRIGDWTKWEVVLLVGTHQIIAQLFQAFSSQRSERPRAGAGPEARFASHPAGR